ncbi:MAG: hypothetical protein IJ996_05960 [Clostridia bacterium]|nr:hypothetical protein [Clostridia bacterium]
MLNEINRTHVTADFSQCNAIRGKRRKYEQDKEREYFATGVYINVHDQNKAQRDAVRGKRRRYEQDKEREYFATGVYIDVHDQAKTQRDAVLRSIYVV